MNEDNKKIKITNMFDVILFNNADNFFNEK